MSPRLPRVVADMPLDATIDSLLRNQVHVVLQPFGEAIEHGLKAAEADRDRCPGPAAPRLAGNDFHPRDRVAGARQLGE